MTARCLTVLTGPDYRVANGQRRISASIATRRRQLAKKLCAASNVIDDDYDIPQRRIGRNKSTVIDANTSSAPLAFLDFGFNIVLDDGYRDLQRSKK